MLYWQGRWLSFGPITKLVAGQFGDVSEDFHDLLNRLVTAKSAHIAQLEGRPVSDSERGILLHQLRRRISVAIIIGQSSCLLTRLRHIEPGAQKAAKRRAVAKHREEIVIKDRQAHFEALIRGRRLQGIGVLRI